MVKVFDESYTYSGHDVSDDLQEYMVTVVIGNSDGNGETGMVAPDYYQVLVSAMDEEDARDQVSRGIDVNDGIADVHLATSEEINDWYSDPYKYESNRNLNESKMEDTMKFMSMQLSGIEDQGLANVLRKIVFMSKVDWSYVNKLVKTYMPEAQI